MLMIFITIKCLNQILKIRRTDLAILFRKRQDFMTDIAVSPKGKEVAV